MRESPASGMVTVIVNGRAVHLDAGSTVAAALSQLTTVTRRSVRGSLRGPLCGMGVCQECRVRIDDQPHCLACQTACRDGMRITTVAAIDTRESEA